MRPDMLTREFLVSFKNRTEEFWREIVIDPAGYGYQFRPGTRWNQGLTDAGISEYESCLGLRFPDDLNSFLGVVNGTDIPMLNVYGGSGESPRYLVDAYADPRDLAEVERRIRDACTSRLDSSVVLSIADEYYAIVYGNTLQEYLENEFLKTTQHYHR